MPRGVDARGQHVPEQTRGGLRQARDQKHDQASEHDSEGGQLEDAAYHDRLSAGLHQCWGSVVLED